MLSPDTKAPLADAWAQHRILDLVWGPDNPAVEAWHEAVEAWGHALVRTVMPAWPWAAVAEGPVAAAPPAPATLAELPAPEPEPFRTHAPGRAIEQLSVGDSASVTKRISLADIEAFARISGDDNPAHVDDAWAEASRFKGRVAHGVLTAGLVSAVLGTELPGPGSIYLSQTLRWLAPVRPDDLLTATATITQIVPEKGRVVLETVVTRDGERVLTGEALVMPPGAKPRTATRKLPAELLSPQPVAQPAATPAALAPPPAPAPKAAKRPAATRPAAKRAGRTPPAKGQA